MTYLALPYAQGDGTKFQWQNCVAACATELIDAGSVGRLRIPAWKIRNASGDVFGGIEYTTASITANRLTRNEVPLTARKVLTRRDVRDLWATRSTAVIINCTVTVHTKHRTNAFRGIHSVTVGGGTEKDRTVKVEDPGTTYAGWARWPVELVLDAMEATGGFYLLTGPQTEDIRRTCRTRAAIRAHPDRSARRLGGIVRGDEVKVIRTTKGGPWKRDDGTDAHGWHVIRWKGGTGYVKGEALA